MVLKFINKLKEFVSSIKVEFTSFIMVGIFSTIVNYSTFASLYSFLNVAYLPSSGIGYVAGVLVGFTFNKRITFKSKDRYEPELAKYFLVYLFSLFLGLSILKTLVANFGLNPLIANVLVIGVTTCTNFTGCKSFAFRVLKLPEIFYSRLFLSVLVIKILFGCLFASNYLVGGTIPFINYFISSGFQNPYDYFLGEGLVEAFPYSTVMLLIESAPTYLFYFVRGEGNISFINLFLARVPLLFADIAIFSILLKLLKTREREVLLYYWCSPIIFYISYFHGQLDAIPISLLMLSIYFLLLKKEAYSSIFLGVALACKASIFIAVPFMFLYLWRNRYHAFKIMKYFAVSLSTYIFLILPFLFSEGYKNLVLSAEEQYWVFFLNIPILVHDIVIYIVPLFFVIFFLRLSVFKHINQDGLIMSLAVAFLALVILVPPMPGWFYWTIPFLSYFFVKYKAISGKHYFILNLFYILHFVIFNKNSDIFQSFQVVSSSISQLDNPYYIILNSGFDACFISSIVFSIFIGILVITLYYIYKQGVIRNLEYETRPLSIGIAGDSGTGKSYTNDLIKDLVGEKNITLLEGDDLHKWERGDVNWKILTHLNPKSNALHADLEYIQKIKSGYTIKRRYYDHSSGKFIPDVEILPSKFIIVSGLHSFYLQKMRRLLDIKVFMDLDEALRRHWKITRDMGERGYPKEKIIEQIKQRDDDGKRYIQPQKEFADVIVNYHLKSPLKNEGDPNEKINLELNLILSNNYDFDEIMSLLSQVETLKTNMYYNEDAKTITCEFYGKISKEIIEEIAYFLLPDLEEVIENRGPVWGADYGGITQLFTLYLISEHLKMKGVI